MNKVKIDVEDIVFIDLPDGSNVQVKLQKDNLIELSFFTASKEKEIREQPVIHMKNSNTFAVELRRNKGGNK